MEIIDFTNCYELKKAYNGANGNKKSVIYNDKIYMLKFPAIAKLNKDISYINSCISEYLGSHIFNILGIKAQETLLGTYDTPKGRKVVVACEDFADYKKGIVFQDFGSIKNQYIDSERNGYGTELNDVLSTIKEYNGIDNLDVLNHFWDMFIVDALIGNWDRHNGNWGFLYFFEKNELFLAPVFDCGSSLFPQADEKIMNDVLSNEKEKLIRVYERPLSALTINDKKINYCNFLMETEDEDCMTAIERIVPRIDMKEIDLLIDNTPFITETAKKFYKTILSARKELILDKALEMIIDKRYVFDERGGR